MSIVNSSGILRMNGFEMSSTRWLDGKHIIQEMMLFIQLQQLLKLTQGLAINGLHQAVHNM